MEAKKNLSSVTMLRGIASLAVCVAHFTGTVQTKWMQETGQFGTNGVYVFFVISGFIIPYALYHSLYKVKNYPSFLVKRIIRLDPPYLATIAIIFLLSWAAQLSPHHTTQAKELFTLNTLWHFFYLVDLKGGLWLNIVFWTLAIEFQYYLLIGLLYPLLVTTNTANRILLFAILCAVPFLLPDTKFVSGYMLPFLVGILLFWFKTKQLTKQLFIFLLLIITGLAFLKHGMGCVISLLFAIGFIQFVNKSFSPLIFLGTISYSLYLLHVPLGTDGFINFLQNYITSEGGRIWLMLAALPFIIICSWVFYLILEKPSMKLAKKIKYKS